ncbi:PD-(D/E)XK nuclease family protein [Jiulongibacter sediminis]|uniref:PD-(D/E)XK nuclease family protein n=1 Tax=Jiulongibacter sediminis TaxID=1605367 RepID=UPI0026F0F1FE|nr:PD-(D/E)XK nuclease family protein [Jiulongibacter sediminis]
MTLEEFIVKSPGLIPKEAEHQEFDSFAISGYPHYENVLSNWFAFFLTTRNEHGFASLFGEALKNAIARKFNIENLDWLDKDLTAVREVITNKGNFIDIILFDEGEPDHKSFSNCLIIEHKINASVYNDLDDYYSSVETSGESGSKTALILSARNRSDNDANFLNICYGEWLAEIRLLLGKYQPYANYKFILYLTDLLINMDKLSDTMDSSNSLNFCFEYGEQIMQLTKVKEQADAQLASQLRTALESTGFEFYKNNPAGFSIRDKDDRILVYTKTEELFSHHKCTYQLWLKGNYAKKWIPVSDITAIKEFAKSKGLEARPKKENENWAEIIRGSFIYDSKSSKDFGEQFADHVSEKFEPLEELIDRLIKGVSPH